MRMWDSIATNNESSVVDWTFVLNEKAPKMWITISNNIKFIHAEVISLLQGQVQDLMSIIRKSDSTNASFSPLFCL